MKKKSKKTPTKTVATLEERTFREVASVGGANSDWALTFLGDDSEVWQNVWALTSRVRDLFRCNPLYQAYRETLWANVLGAQGIMLRMRVKEQEDRVIHIPEEKEIKLHNERRERVMEYYATKAGEDWKNRTIRFFTKSISDNGGKNGSRIAQVKVGEPDVFANQLIERKWQEWQRMEYCDARGTRNYQTIRQLRLISAVRDGDFFIRMIQDPRVNKFGFSLQIINAEWCDRFYNTILPNGNEVRMGIEYQFTPWGIGKPVAYYFIKRQPMDWQWSTMAGFNFATGNLHERVPAEEIIHYARAVDADSTRPAPWVASTIPSSRQRDQAMLAEVIAWRESACKTGFYWSDVNPEGGMVGEVPNPRVGIPTQEMAPGETRGLPWGVKYQERDPTHPNASVKEFRMASIQDGCAGMPGANYSTMANDYAAINFSAGRLQRLDTNETNMLLQQFDIDYAENKIFEAWLKMSLITGAIPLPVSKFDKFNSKTFQGRRWRGVDEVKEVTAAALRVANNFSSDQRECADVGLDFEEVLFEQAEANMLKEMLGINPLKTVESGAPPVEEEDEEPSPGEGEKPKPKPKKKARVSSTTRF